MAEVLNVAILIRQTLPTRRQSSLYLLVGCSGQHNHTPATCLPSVLMGHPDFLVQSHS